MQRQKQAQQKVLRNVAMRDRMPAMAMTGFAKVFGSLVTSSIWCEDDATLRVWIAMLVTCDQDGIVEGSVPGFANLCRVSVQTLEKSLEKLMSPDPHSRTPDHGGRRIEKISGGWLVLNYAKYRALAEAKEGSRAPYYREYRKRKREMEFKESTSNDK
jgi:hypothetical protein